MKESFGKFMAQAADVLRATEAKYGFVKGLKAAFTVMTADFDAQAAGVDSVLSLGAVPSVESQGSFIVAKMSLVSPALVTGATATALTFTFNQYRAGVLVVALGSLVTNTGVNLAAHAETAVPVTGAPNLLPGDVIEVAVTHASTGTAIPQGLKAKVEVQ